MKHARRSVASRTRTRGDRAVGALAILALAALGPGLAPAATAASHEEAPEAREMPTSKKYGRSDTATIERLEPDALVVTDPGVEGATLRYALDAETVVVRPDGAEAGLGALSVGDRVAIDAHDRLDEGDPVAKVIHVVVEASGDAEAAE